MMGRSRLSPIRGRRELLLLAGPSNPAAARFIVQRHEQAMDRRVSFVDRLVDRALLIESQYVQPLPALQQEKQHRPDPVAECFGLLGRKAQAFHRDTVYRYIIGLSRLKWPDGALWSRRTGPDRPDDESWPVAGLWPRLDVQSPDRLDLTLLGVGIHWQVLSVPGSI